MELDLTNLLGQLTVTAITLGIAALGYSAWFASGIANAAIKTKTWSWKRTFTDLGKVALAVYVVFAVVLGFNLIQMVAKIIGADISVFTSVLSTTVVAGTALIGAGNFFTKAINNVWALWKFKQIDASEVKAVEDTDFTRIGEQTKEAIGMLAEFLNTEEGLAEQTLKAEEEELGGRGRYYPVKITSYDVFRAQVLGNGFDIDGAYGNQCWDGCALLWQQLGRTLQTGNGCAYGCWTLKRDENAGSNFLLITDKNAVKRGDVVVFSGGQYGHIGYADENYNGSGAIKLLGQNQGGANGNFNIISMSMAGFLGAFRFKGWTAEADAGKEPAQPTTPQKSNEQIADEVIAGKWGNDPERTQKLKAAGYNRDAIQAIVDAKLAPAKAPAAAPKSNKIELGSTVVPTRLVDYNGTPVRQYDSTYVVIQLTGSRAVLSARGSVWAAMRTQDLKLA